MKNAKLYKRTFKNTGIIIFTALLATACGNDNGDNEQTLNTAPVAEAGSDQNNQTGTVVELSASNSFDADNDPITYLWYFSSIPPGSSTSLSDTTSISPTFIPDVEGSYTVNLVVDDGQAASTADSVVITSSNDSSNTAPINITYTYPIVDTNQSACYDSATGQEQTCTGGTDADYSGHQPSYTLTDDGLTVTDNVTGLIWGQSSDINDDGVVNYDDKLYQSEAVSYCENSTLAGKTDWRLPSVKEAYSLMLFTGKDPSNYQGTDTSGLVLFQDDMFDRAFGDLNSAKDRIIDGQYASTSLYVSTTMNGNSTMFGVNYVDGRIKGYPTKTKEYYVRCVTGNTQYGINNFTDNGDSTISDNATGLMWQQNDSLSTDWEDAIQQCESSTTASFTNWRLPNAKELHSLVDYTRSPDTHNSAAIDPIFNATSFENEESITDWGSYWASSTHVDNSDNGSNATYISFGRALGYMNDTILDVHGAGSQRSDDKLDVSTEPGASSETGETGVFYYKGPQGDILRNDNHVRCVRDIDVPTESEASEGYTLFSPMKSTDTYLINPQGNTVHTWESDYRPGLSVYLLESGELLRTGALTDKPATFTGQFGGSAGVVEILDQDSNIVWSKTLATESYLSHHDVEILPSGNILAVVWEAKTKDEALALGRNSVSDDTLWAGAIYEICRTSAQNTCTDGEIVWQWRVWDHVIQNIDSSISSTYVTDINEHQNKIDLNYYTAKPGSDWTHINSVDYNAETDQILVSVRGFSEYWVIDHGDSSQGIVARLGNPTAHDGSGDQQLFSQHDAQWVIDSSPSNGNITVFNNGADRSDGDYSSVDEYCYAGENCTRGELISSYTKSASGGFYADHISGAQRLSNGNTLVCDGTAGQLFEYNKNNEVIWTFDNDGEIFKATRYFNDFEGFNNNNIVTF